MAKLIATEGFRTSNLVKHEYEPSLGYCREVVVYNGAAKTFPVGQLLEANGTVADDAGDIFGIVMQETVAPASTATRVLVLAGGPAIVSKSAIALGGLLEADVIAALDAKGIKVNDSV
jgi:hypothetical protein